MLSNGALKFSRVTLGDAGMYQCLAKNEAGVAVGRTKLVLQGNNVNLQSEGKWSFLKKCVSFIYVDRNRDVKKAGLMHVYFPHFLSFSYMLSVSKSGTLL